MAHKIQRKFREQILDPITSDDVKIENTMKESLQPEWNVDASMIMARVRRTLDDHNCIKSIKRVLLSPYSLLGRCQHSERKFSRKPSTISSARERVCQNNSPMELSLVTG